MEGTSKKGSGLPKLRELLRRQRRDSDNQTDSPDLDFEYDDAESYTSEISELYSYTEEDEFTLNRKCFEETFPSYTKKRWMHSDSSERKAYIIGSLNSLDAARRDERMKTARALLYLAQGVFGVFDCEEDQVQCSCHNVFLLHQCGVFTAFVELLLLESENSNTATTALRKPAVSIVDSTDLRVILSVLYIMVETMRLDSKLDTQQHLKQQEAFKQELGQPVAGEECLAVILFGMVTKFCSGHAPHFPIKKILLLLWKTVLLSLGSFVELAQMKEVSRAAAGLLPTPDDSIQVVKNLRASAPPISNSDFLEQASAKKGNRKNKILMKQSPVEEDREEKDDNNRDEFYLSDEEENRSLLRPLVPSQEPRALPWTPKVRLKDIELFLEHTRTKFIGFRVYGDSETVAGLPQPIHEGVGTLKKYIYVSLADEQVKKEHEISKHPISKGDEPIPETAVELLYQSLLPTLPQNMIALLKILLAAAPTSKAKTDSINILADVLPEEMPITVLQSMKLGMDVNRHKEIIVKAISALLLLLLKHFKLNHVYQFEFMSQHLVFANCIPLILKFFNQNILAYVTAKNSIPAIDFPSCVIGEQPELSAEGLEVGDAVPYCWRNLFSCINLLRILNKLTKWKHSRTMMLVVFKSAPILKRALKVKHAMMQLYVLKLLKMQTKYLGRQWRKSNMKTMSAIYQKVRHRLNDDWAYGNDMDARPWDFQAEECGLRAAVDRFNTRRYDAGAIKDADFVPFDNNLQSVLGQAVELSEEFKEFYQKWLDREVYSTTIDWQQLLKDTWFV